MNEHCNLNEMRKLIDDMRRLLEDLNDVIMMIIVTTNGRVDLHDYTARASEYCYELSRRIEALVACFGESSINAPDPDRTVCLDAFPGYDEIEIDPPVSLIEGMPEGISRSVEIPKAIDDTMTCDFCGTTVNKDSRFCSNCGSCLQAIKPNIDIRSVTFSAVAPKTFLIGSYSLVDVIMYEDSYRSEVDKILANSDIQLSERTTESFDVSIGSTVRIVLSSNDVKIKENEMEAVWRGKYSKFSFSVFLPVKYSKQSISFSASIYFNNVIATRIAFIAKCSSCYEQKLSVLQDNVLTAFVSYASLDRNDVLRVIQGMKAARGEMEVFLDVDGLRSRQDWKEALACEIDRRDVLYLCWSQNAKQSKWVNYEWRHAYKKKGIDCIEPIMLELPTVCPPPNELVNKHCNDKYLYFRDNNIDNIASGYKS